MNVNTISQKSTSLSDFSTKVSSCTRSSTAGPSVMANFKEIENYCHSTCSHHGLHPYEYA